MLLKYFCCPAQVWSSGWGPEALAKLDHASGMLGSWKVVLAGDFTGIPFTTLWRHRYSCTKLPPLPLLARLTLNLEL